MPRTAAPLTAALVLFGSAYWGSHAVIYDPGAASLLVAQGNVSDTLDGHRTDSSSQTASSFAHTH